MMSAGFWARRICPIRRVHRLAQKKPAKRFECFCPNTLNRLTGGRDHTAVCDLLHQALFAYFCNGAETHIIADQSNNNANERIERLQQVKVWFSLSIALEVSPSGFGLLSRVRSVLNKDESHRSRMSFLVDIEDSNGALMKG